jgi:hypothetical protein
VADEADDVLPIGAKIVDVFRNGRLTWLEGGCELIDNALDADATQVSLCLSGDILVVADNGRGCSDLKKMEAIACHHPQATTKAGRYGIGGVMTQINFSRAGRVQVESTTDDFTSFLEIDWGKCIELDRIQVTRHSKHKRHSDAKNGTVITIYNCKQPKKPSELARDLSHLYARELGSRRQILLEVDGRRYPIAAMKRPRLAPSVDISFEIDGHKITGYCGIVPPKVANPHSGWWVSFAHRLLGPYTAPAEGCPTNRIYGEIVLPKTWKNINITKTDLSDDDERLWTAVAAQCREVVEAAATQSEEFELTECTRATEGLIAGALAAQRVKGRRPNRNGASGATQPTGNGSPHAKFTYSQPGDKGDAPSGDENAKERSRMPSKVRIVWDETLSSVYHATISGMRDRQLILTLNPHREEFRKLREDPALLAFQCKTFIAREISEGRPEFQDAFPMFRDEEYHEILNKLCSTESKPEVVGV